MHGTIFMVSGEFFVFLFFKCYSSQTTIRCGTYPVIGNDTSLVASLNLLVLCSLMNWIHLSHFILYNFHVCVHECLFICSTYCIFICGIMYRINTEIV